MLRSFSVGRIAGIRLEINPSWLIILVLLTSSLATNWFPQMVPHLNGGVAIGLGLLASLLLFASVVVHEMAHALVARARGLPVSSVTLFIFGGVSNLEQEPRTAGAEFQLSIVGPLASLLIGGIALGGLALLPAQLPILAALLHYLGVTNIILGLFNLIPGFPLDGGRVFRSLIWGATGNLRVATQWATGVGQLVAYVFIVFGLLQVFSGALFTGLWIAFIGWFLLHAAQNSNTQVQLESVMRGVTVGQIMQPTPLIVAANRTVRQLVDTILLPNSATVVPVEQMGRFAGMITLDEVRHVPQDQWDQTTVGQVMTPLTQLHTVRPEQSVLDVLPQMVGRNVNLLPVVAGDEHLVGMVTHEAIVHFLTVRSSLDIPHPRQPSLTQAST